MGISALQSLGVSFPLLSRRDLAPAELAMPEQVVGAEPSAPEQRGADAAKWTDNREQEIAKAFDAMVYQSRVQEMSLAARFQEIAARTGQVGEEESADAAAQAQQLTFDFFAETRTEELVRFGQRTEQVAEGLDGTRSTTYLEVSRQIAARFEFSLSMSGSALNGFAGASEDSQGLNEVLDQILGLTQELLGASDDAFNEFWSMFDGVDTGALQERFNDLFNQLAEQLLGGALFTGAQPSAGQGQAATASVTNIQLEFSFSFSFSASVTVSQEVVQQSDPIILDLDGDGYELTNHKDGARFDIQGNGNRATTAFVTGGDAFLAIDRNGDGIINSGSELVGDQNGAANGFEELRKFDSNGDNRINRLDKDFDKLLLFRDNGNGITEAGELLTLEQAGIEEISLNYTNVNSRTSGGNRLGQIASFLWANGSRGAAADAILNFIA